VDLYLIPWPVRLKQDVEGINFKGEDVIPFDIKGTREAMEDCYRLTCRTIYYQSTINPHTKKRRRRLINEKD
jgi:hypothetical protein